MQKGTDLEVIRGGLKLGHVRRIMTYFSYYIYFPFFIIFLK